MSNSHYVLAPKKDVQSDHDEVSGLLYEYWALLRPLAMRNYYRELPITSLSPLKRLESGRFEVTVSEMHLQVICTQMHTIFSIGGSAVLAECRSTDIHAGTAVLSNFRYIDLQADQRQSFRLNVDADLVVDFRNEGGRIAGRLVDISLTGCKIIIHTGTVLAGSAAMLEIHIFDQERNKELCRSIAAVIVHAYCRDEINYCCLEFIGTPSDQELLSRYLNQKQTSLIREFREHKVLPA